MCVFPCCCCCCCCCFDYSGMLRTKYYTHCTMLPIILFCCSFLSSSMSSLLFFLSLFAFAFISLWMRESARLCVWVCVCLQNFSAFILFHIYAQYVYEFAGKKVKRQIEKQAKVSEKVANSILEYVNAYENSIWCVTKHTHTHLHRKIYTIRERDM